MEENKRRLEAETFERYELANSVSLRALKLFDSMLDKNTSVKNIKAAGDLAAKLINKESAVEFY